MRNLRMRTKLALAFGIMLLLTVALGVGAWKEMTRIGGDAAIIESAIMPQSDMAFLFAGQMREAGLNIRAFAATGDPQRLALTRTSIAAMQESLDKAAALSRAYPLLSALPPFLQAFPTALNSFSGAVDSIEAARAQIERDTARLLQEGPKLRQAINTLVDITNAALIQNGRAENFPAVERLSAKGEVFGTLLEMCEALQRDFFTARAMNNKSMMEAVVRNFADPTLVINLMLQETFNEDDKAPLAAAKTALEAYQTAVLTTVAAVEAVDKAETQVAAAFAVALEQTQKLATAARTGNAAIASTMSGATANAINVVLALLAGSVLVGLLLTVLLTRNITGPLGLFVAAAGKLSSGHFDTRVDIRGADEIGMAASDINKAFDVVVDKMLWYESMLDAIPSVISVTDMQRRWTFLNTAAEKAVGKTRAVLTGRDCRESGFAICGSQDCAIASLEQGKTSPGWEINGRRMAVQASYIKNRAGQNIGHIEVASDVTELAQAQQRAESALTEGMHAAAARIEGVVAGISATMAALSRQVAQSETGASEQAASMAETSHAMEQMNATVLEVARNAGAASEVSTQTRQKAENGANVVRRVIESIGHVRERSLELKQDMATLGEHARSINEIMGVISDIADQTNLLALNAAIEAARAGEAGRGFAVVADEVRKLAEKTMTSTADVDRAIRAIQQSAEKSIRQVDAAVEDVQASTTLAGESGEALGGIVHMVDVSADQVRAIAAAAEQQSASSEEISLAVQRVNGIADTTAHAMREAALALDNLNAQAQKLAHLIEEMKN